MIQTKKHTDSEIQSFDGIFDNEISYFSGAKDNSVVKNYKVKDFLIEVMNDKTNKKRINELRNLENSEEISLYKINNLPAVSLSGTFNKKRGVGLLDKHSNIIQIDIDYKIGDFDKNVFEKNLKLIQNDKYTLFCFISPSGKGIKVGVKIDGDHHSETFKKIEIYYKTTYDIIIDSSVKDISRLCFLSYDEELHINPFSTVFEIAPSNTIENMNTHQETEHKNTNNISNNRKNSSNKKYITEDNEIFSKPKANDVLKRECDRLRNSVEGEKYNTRLKVGCLIGGFVGGGSLDSNIALSQILEAALSNTTTPGAAEKNIRQSFNYGYRKPIYKSKEQQFYLHKDNNNGKRIIRNKENDSIEVEHVDQKNGAVVIYTIPFCFWIERKIKKDVFEVDIDHHKLYKFVKMNGFVNIKLRDNDNNYIMARIDNNIADEVEISYINRFIKDYIDSLPEYVSPNINKEELHNKFLKGINSYIDKGRNAVYLDIININDKLNKDTEDSSFFYFNECYVEVTKGKIVEHNYTDLNDKIIWRSQINARNFSLLCYDEEENKTKIDDCMYSKFIKNLSTHKKTKVYELERHIALKVALGFLLHNYNCAGFNKAVVFTEADISDDPKGGTGKSLIMQSISKMRKITRIDGKNFNAESQFKFQTVTIDTSVIFIDDVKPQFTLENLFYAITEGVEIELKGKDKIKIEIKDSPKFVIGSNYGLKGSSESHKRRKLEIEILSYYNSVHTPYEDFGCFFFSGWSEEEWLLFDNFMIGCVRLYFERVNKDNGFKFPEYKSNTMSEKRLLVSTNSDFIEYVVNISLNEVHITNVLYENYLKAFNIKENVFSQHKFSKWIKEYASINNFRLTKYPKNINGKNKWVFMLEEYK